MSKQTVLSRKKRGPAPTGKGTLLGVRLQPPALDALDTWIGRQSDEPSRPEAIRRLVEQALIAPKRNHFARMTPLKSESPGMERDSRGHAIPMKERTAGDRAKAKRAKSKKVK